MCAVRLMAALRGYARSEEGSVLPLVGLASVALIGTMGLAVDVGRASLVHAKLLNAADASGLAVGARLSTTDLTAEAEKFVRANFPRGYAGASLTNVTATANADGDVIQVNASAVMPTTLLQIVGVYSVNLNVTSEITRGISGLELVLALDNTGSMHGTKLADLKVAANNLLDILYGPDDVAEDLYVGIVPFSQSVNVGSSRAGWLKANSLSSKDWGTTSWGGCVEGQYEYAGNSHIVTRDMTDEAPASQAAKLEPYYWPDDGNNNWIRQGNGNGNGNGNGGTNYAISWYSGPNLLCPAEVTPLTTSKETLTSAIDDMQAVGWTYINLGASWAWRMLSPNWRGYWGGEMDTSNLPLDYNAPMMSKAVVIMTDGDHEISPDWYGAYGYLSRGRLGTTSKRSAEARMDARLTTVCNNMKQQGIIVYTVVFGTLTSQTETMMQNCATQPDFYFSSPTGDDLNAAFRTIGDSLANLRLSR